MSIFTILKFWDTFLASRNAKKARKDEENEIPPEDTDSEEESEESAEEEAEEDEVEIIPLPIVSNEKGPSKRLEYIHSQLIKIIFCREISQKSPY